MTRVWWFKAPIPPRFHRCKAINAGMVTGNLVERCACGAIRLNGNVWLEKNSRRKMKR